MNKKTCHIILALIVYLTVNLQAYCAENTVQFINNFSTCSKYLENGERRISFVLGWSTRKCYYKEISSKETIICGFKTLELEDLIKKMKSENYQVENGLSSLRGARKYLEDVFGRACPGFAWPCSCNTPETCDLLRENGFAYARLVGETDDITQYSDPMLLTPNCHFQARDFYERYEKAKSTGVFYFWGHTYEMMDSDGMWNQLEQKIAYITNDPESEWADVIDIFS